MEKNYTQAQKSMIWTTLLAFLAVNIFCVLLGTLTPFGGDRIVTIIEIIFWFDLTCVALIGSFFGLNIVLSKYNNKTLIT